MTSRSDDRQELVPALSAEPPERDPNLIELVRAYVSAEIRRAEDPDFVEDESTRQEIEQGLDRYAEELAVARKVDGYCYLMAWAETQRDLVDKEIKRLRTRKTAAENILRRLKQTAQMALSLLPQPKRGQPREIRGNTVSLALYANPEKVEITAGGLVPPEYQDIEVQMPLTLWHSLREHIPAELRETLNGPVQVKGITVRKRDLMAVLKAGTRVEGVELIQDFRVVRK